MIESAKRASDQESPRPVSPDEAGLKLAEGVELIGEYKGSGFKEPPYIARRSDGQTIQLPRLLYLIADRADGRRSLHEIADRVSQEYGRGVSPENVNVLVDKKLRPLGVLASADGSSPKLAKPNPMLALKFRAALIPPGLVNAVTTVLRPLFWPLIVLVVVAGLVGLDAWLFFSHGVAQSLRTLINQPIFFLLVFLLVVVSAAFHECGHATGLRYGGGKPGVMGAGLYLVWPAFYTDVTDAYRLGKGGRLRADLGGVYFNTVFMLLTLGAYLVTHFEPLLAIILFQQFEMLHQFLPFLRLDGYYVISDLTGVPDIFARIKPALLSLIPGRKPDPRITELKPWVRVVVTLWVVATAVFILYAYGMMLLHLPRIIGTAIQSLLSQIDKTAGAIEHGNALVGGLGALQIALLLLPLAGIGLTLIGVVKKIVVVGWVKTRGRPIARSGFTLVGAAVALLIALAWWPHNNNYRPIQPSDTGTFQSSFQNLTWPVVIDLVFAQPSASPAARASAAPAPPPVPVVPPVLPPVSLPAPALRPVPALPSAPALASVPAASASAAASTVASPVASASASPSPSVSPSSTP